MLNILIENNVSARTPRRFGVNVENQEHYDRCNIWDWLADSGATVIREFHPERYLRKEPMNPRVLAGIRSKGDFDRWRRGLAGNPKRLPWHLYKFNEPVEWLGVPDGIVGKLKEGRLEPIISMGYYPRMFPEPLLKSLDSGELAPHGASYTDVQKKSPLAEEDWTEIPPDSEINWRAAACAYEYYFAFIYHYAVDFGVKYFNLHNEPEFYYRNFHFPSELMPDPPRYHEACASLGGESAYLVPMIMQMAVLSRIARLAMDDVKRGLKGKAPAGELTLSCPAWSGLHEYYWKLAHPYVDICDYHHYACDHRLFERAQRRAAILAAGMPGKRTACTEYGRKGGPIRIGDLLFDIAPALEAAGLMMSALSFTRPDDPPCEFVTFYHFQFPATHRNYKNLVYGDMNCLDWSGQDKPLNKRGEQYYPTFGELQIRHPTAAYHMFRMLARCAPGKDGNEPPYAVLDSTILTRRETYSLLRTLAVNTGRDLLLNILNPSNEKVCAAELDLRMFHGRFKFAVVRETSRFKSDEVVSQAKIESDRVQFDIPAQSLMQIILTTLDLNKVISLRLVEETFTPGSALKGLRQYETTRFRALGIIDGREYDLSQMNIVWRSSEPECMPVYQGGLTVCMKPGLGSTTIHATTVDEKIIAEIVLKEAFRQLVMLGSTP